jgi:hypothetical protein
MKREEIKLWYVAVAMEIPIYTLFPCLAVHRHLLVINDVFNFFGSRLLNVL